MEEWRVTEKWINGRMAWNREMMIESMGWNKEMDRWKNGRMACNREMEEGNEEQEKEGEMERRTESRKESGVDVPKAKINNL